MGGGGPGRRSGLEGGQGEAAARKKDLAASLEGLRSLAALEPKAGEEVGKVLLKPVDRWTEREMKTLMADPDYWRAGTRLVDGHFRHRAGHERQRCGVDYLRFARRSVALDLGPGMERGRASQVSTGVSSRPPHSVQEPS